MLLAARAEGFTGSDIVVAIRDALLEPIRRLQLATKFKQVGLCKWKPCRPVEDGEDKRL